MKKYELFQFTPLREGRRIMRLVKQGKNVISIHAPPRGATREAALMLANCFISIHAPPRGATGAVISRRRRRGISIHAPPRGATG